MPGFFKALRRAVTAALGTAACLVSFGAMAGGAAPLPKLSAALAPAMANPMPGAGAAGQLHRGVFLVASRELRDANFAESVILLVAYGNEGAIGVIINRPTSMPVSRLLPEFKQLSALDAKVLIGGPVGLNTIRLLVHKGPPVKGRVEVFPGTYLVDSQELLRKLLSQRDNHTQLRFYAGYAGWAPGQLDAEVRRGDWYVRDADVETVFDKPAREIWPDLIRGAGGQWVRREPTVRNALASRETPVSMYAPPAANMQVNGTSPGGTLPSRAGVGRGKPCVKQFTFHLPAATALPRVFYN